MGGTLGVCNTDVGKAVDSEVGVDYTAVFEREHRTGGTGVEFGADLAF